MQQGVQALAEIEGNTPSIPSFLLSGWFYNKASVSKKKKKNLL